MGLTSVEIDFDSGTSPIRGVIRNRSRGEHPFVGWLELMSALHMSAERAESPKGEDARAEYVRQPSPSKGK